MLKSPEISIIIRTHNSEKYIKNTLESALNQTLDGDLYEIVVVDDGSTDKTRDILKEYSERIRQIEKSKIGPMQALNEGIRHSRGKYAVVLDSDDLFEPNILEELYNKITDNESIAFVYPDYYEYDETTQERQSISVKENIFNSVAVGILFRKEVLAEVGYYDENLIFPEYDLLLKIMEKYKGKHVSKPLFTYIRHPGSITSNKETIERGINQIYEKYGKKIPIRSY